MKGWIGHAGNAEQTVQPERQAVKWHLEIDGFFCLSCVFAIACDASIGLAQSASEAKQDVENPVVRQIVLFADHASEVTSLAFRPDGREIVIASLKDVQIWDPATGTKIGAWKGDRGHAVPFSPDGRRIAISGFKEMKMHDATNMKVLWSIDVLPASYSPPYMAALAFSPDGKQLATSAVSSRDNGRRGIVQIWDASTGKELRRFDDLSPDPLPLLFSSNCVAFSPDGKYLAAGSNGVGGELPEPGEIRVWEVGNGRLLHTLIAKERIKAGEDQHSMTSVAFQPDGKQLVSAGSDGVIRFWDLSSGKAARTLSGHRRWIRQVVFSPNGNRLASAGHDGVVQIWNVATGENIQTIPFDVGKITTLAFSPDGRRIAAGGGNSLRIGKAGVWEVDSK